MVNTDFTLSGLLLGNAFTPANISCNSISYFFFSTRYFPIICQKFILLSIQNFSLSLLDSRKIKLHLSWLFTLFWFRRMKNSEANSIVTKKEKGIQIEGYPVEGLSIGGQETCIILPSLKLAFDIGRCPQRAISQDFLFISHGHMDHIVSSSYSYSFVCLRFLLESFNSTEINTSHPYSSLWNNQFGKQCDVGHPLDGCLQSNRWSYGFYFLGFRWGIRDKVYDKKNKIKNIGIKFSTILVIS